MANELAAWVGAVAGLGSLVVAIIALVRSNAAQKESDVAQQKSSDALQKSSEAQRRIVEIEEQREQDRRVQTRQANLRAELRTTARGSYRLCLINEGVSDARNIRIEMNDMPFSEHPVAGEDMPDLVGRRSVISCYLATRIDDTNCSPPFKLKVTWDDDFEQNRIYQTTLTF
ncbi:MAG: hypothetical protein FWD61_03700 [Phycisphaerales bacterium]|nr:hypothetical protein [Phycisphaerales bacterium]